MTIMYKFINTIQDQKISIVLIDTSSDSTVGEVYQLNFNYGHLSQSHDALENQIG